LEISYIITHFGVCCYTKRCDCTLSFFCALG